MGYTVELQGYVGEEGDVSENGTCVYRTPIQTKHFDSKQFVECILHTPAFILLCHTWGKIYWTQFSAVIDLTVVTLSRKLCCCSLVLCAPHCGVVRNPYYVII